MADPANPGVALTITVHVAVAESAVGVTPRLFEEIQEFADRMNSIGAAAQPATEEPYDDGPRLLLVPDSRLARLDEEPVQLTRREFDLLLFLCRNRQRVISREEMLSQVWGYSWTGGTRTVDVHIRRLRMKLGQGVLSTVHGVGYRIDDQVQLAIAAEARRAVASRG